MEDLAKLEEILGYKFNNIALLNQALTHSSFANEIGMPHCDNERLEFLGDALLDMVISIILFSSESDKAEGDLTKLRASVVCERALAKISKDKGINNFLMLGKGEEASGGRTRDSIVADAVEAIIGAIYLDGGFSAASNVVANLFDSALRDAEMGKLPKDTKTELQEILQAKGPCEIKYDLVSEEGPDHDKSFTFTVSANGKVIGDGKGKSKKEAQQKAAEAALRGINEL